MSSSNSNKSINCVVSMAGNLGSIYLPLILLGLTIKEDDTLIQYINNLLYVKFLKHRVNRGRVDIHWFYLEFLVVVNYAMTNNLIEASVVDLIYDEQIARYNSVWIEVYTRFKRVKSILPRDNEEQFYFTNIGTHTVENAYFEKDIINRTCHPYLLFTYIWSYIMRDEKMSFDKFLLGNIGTFQAKDIAKLALPPHCTMKERGRASLVSALLTNKLDRCPLWLSNTFPLNKH